MNSRSIEQMQLTLGRGEFASERDAVLNGKSSHAYIIEGSEGIGKFSYALAVSCVNFCKGENKPCLECAECRKVLEGHHPDVHFVEPERGILRVSQVREIISTLYETPYEGGAKIYIIKEFDKANEQAQNAFLKTLEEPPSSVVFFLLVENSHMLLDTVRSRCKRVHLSGFDSAAIAHTLKPLCEDERRVAAAAEECDGNIGKALKLTGDDEYFRLMRLALDIVENRNAAMPEIAGILEKETELLPVLYDCFCNALRKKGDAETLLRFKAVGEAMDAKKKNINGGLITERLAYSLAKGGTKWHR